MLAKKTKNIVFANAIIENENFQALFQKEPFDINWITQITIVLVSSKWTSEVWITTEKLYPR